MKVQHQSQKEQVHAIVQEAQQLEGETKNVDALRLYQRALDIDDLYEGFYQGVMRCSLLLNNPADGMTAYQRCRNTLHTKLNVPPSKQTEQLRDQLQRT